MSIDEMRKAMQEFCWGVKCDCPSCPVVVVHGLCETYNWDNAPEDLVKKAYLLAFGEVKEGKTMNIKADDIRKAALELIEEIAQGEFESGGVVNASTCASLGYIYGVCKLAEMVAGGEADV